MSERLIKEITIASQFNGPPTSGNGGYVSGMIAGFIDGVAEVALKAPPPLDKSLQLYETDEGLSLKDGDQLLAVAIGAEFDLDVPALPLGADRGVFPEEVAFKPFGECYVCGDQRTVGDGLCIHSKPYLAPEHQKLGLVGCDWELTENLKNANGEVAPVYLWSGLDCPGYAACAYGEPALLARMKAKLLKPLRGDRATVIGWQLGASGRKRMCGTAIYSEAGELIAYAEALWIVVSLEHIAA